MLNSSKHYEQSYCFDDILMKPLKSSIKSRTEINLNVNIASSGRELILKTPLISSPMDTVTETQMAIKMALMGGLGIIHRFNTISDQVEQVRKVKRYLQYIIPNPYSFKPNDKYAQLLQKRADFGILSFCIVDDQNKLIDIITNRDLKYSHDEITTEYKQNPNLSIKDILMILATAEHCTASAEYLCDDGKYYNDNTDNNTPINKLTGRRSVTVIELTQEEFNNSMTNIEAMRKIVNNARNIMIRRKFEKIPIITNDGQLIGLITWKNVMHFYTNETSACLDKHGRLCVGAAIGIVGDYWQRLNALVDIGVDLICVDVANGFNDHVLTVVRKIRTHFPTLIIMAGNVCESIGFYELAKTGVDCIRVGIGNGSICTTRGETGIGFGQFSAVNECFDTVISHYFDVKIICDGGSLGKTGNKVKALASGASAIMLGRTLASTEEAPGQIIIRNGRRFKYVRGMASTMANLSKQENDDNNMQMNSYITSDKLSDNLSDNLSDKSINTEPYNKKRKTLNTKFTAEGVDGEQEMTGSVSDIIEQINGGLKSGLSYLGANNIQDVHIKRRADQIKFCISTAIGMTETGIRVKTL